MSIAAFTKHFEVLKDPRQAAKITYPLFDLISKKRQLPPENTVFSVQTGSIGRIEGTF